MNMTILKLCTDASAAKGVAQRQGGARIKHFGVESVRVQEREKEGDFVILTVPRLEMRADLAYTSQYRARTRATHVEDG